MAEKFIAMRQNCFTNCQRSGCVTSTFVFKAHNSEPLPTFREHNSYFWLNVIFYAPTPLTDLRLIIDEASKSCSDTPQSLGLLWTSDRALTTHNTHKIRVSMPLGGIQTRNPKKRVAADPRLDCATTGIDCFNFRRWRKYRALYLEETKKIYVVKPEI